MNKKVLLLLEIVWIAVGVLCIAAGTRYAVNNSGSKVYIFFLMAIVSFIFAFIRHRQRKKN
jgi:uncharacterized membrane protein